MGRVDGKVAFITGAARGQGRAHAIRLAQEGADIIATDICGPLETTVGPPSTPEQLEETAEAIRALGRRVVTRKVDVRNYDELETALEEGVAELGRLDVAIANAGCWTLAKSHELSEKEWQGILDVNLTGVWHTTKAATKVLLRQGQGGSLIMTGSLAALRGFPHISHYSAAKHGVVGLMESLVNELSQDWIRVNVVNPVNVNTDLIHNEETYRLFMPDLEFPAPPEIVEERFGSIISMPIGWVEVEDVANAVLFLASDEARYVSGCVLNIDGGGYRKV